MFNGQPLLVQQLHQKQINGTGVIAAGPRSHPKGPSRVKQADNNGAKNAYQQGDPYHDPWASYAPSMPSVPTVASPSVPFPDSASSAPNRSVTGPVANLLQQQEDRLHVVETMMGKLQEQQTGTIQTMESRFKEFNEQLSQHVQTTKQGFEYMQRENVNLHQTIAQALQQQDLRIASSFDELKSLFLANRGVKRAKEPCEDPEEES